MTPTTPEIEELYESLRKLRQLFTKIMGIEASQAEALEIENSVHFVYGEHLGRNQGRDVVIPLNLMRAYVEARTLCMFMDSLPCAEKSIDEIARNKLNNPENEPIKKALVELIRARKRRQVARLLADEV